MPAAPAPPAPTAAPTVRVRIWDLPTRVFHWTLALAVVALVVTAKVGGNAMVWHFRLGYLVLGLLVFRLLWGVVGGHWSRFARFAYGPGATLRYLRGRPNDGDRFDVGHSPLGALSVFALLGVLAAQVATGLVADDEIANVGPLNRFVETATGLAATGWHKGYGQWLVIGLTVLHVVAVFVYLARRRNLIAPMWHGDKALVAGVPASGDGARERSLALALAVIAATLVAWVIKLGG